MSVQQGTSENQPSLFSRDATAADLIADLAEAACPLGCAERPRFQGKRNKRLRYQCGGCHLVFEITPKPPAGPTGGAA
jgi:hypothetical protein